MAHALYGHDGPCKNIHGHTYHLEVTILGTPLSKPGDPHNGMVLDFSDLKTLVEREIVQHFDHALVLNEDSPHKELHGLREQFEKVIFLPVQPTCENLLVAFKNRLQHFFDAHHQLIGMKLRETPKSYAEWRKEDN
jgi:6-pyruvoyltetrahydropterin/6-carboxytetrahydropterin synthase